MAVLEINFVAAMTIFR